MLGDPEMNLGVNLEAQGLQQTQGLMKDFIFTAGTMH